MVGSHENTGWEMEKYCREKTRMAQWAGVGKLWFLLKVGVGGWKCHGRKQRTFKRKDF